MKASVVLFGALMAVFVASKASAQELAYWDTVNGWDILVDPTLGDGCLIQAEFDDGTYVRIGLDMSDENGYVTLVNDEFDGVVAGDVYELGFLLDDEAYVGDARGIELGGVKGVDIVFDSMDFLFGLAESNVFTAIDPDGEEISFSLEGTYGAMEEMIACQEEM